MANNCLVTTLKASVQNDNLPYLGRIKFIIPANSQGRNGIEGGGDAILEGDPTKVYFSDSTYSQNLGQTVPVSLGMYIVNNSNSDAVLWITNYYTITRIFDWGHQDNILIDKNDNGAWLEYLSDSLNYFVGGLGKSFYNINFDGLKNKIALTDISIRDAGTGNLDSFSGLVNLTTLRFINSAVKGNIASLIALKNLTTLVLTNDDSLYGDVEELFVGLLDAGKTGELSFDMHGTQIKLHNATLANIFYSATFATNSIIIKDNNSNTVASYDGASWTYA